MKLRPDYESALLNLPRYKGVDTDILFKLVKDKLSSRRRGPFRGIHIDDRASAIAILVGSTKLDDPSLQIPLIIDSTITDIHKR